MKSVFKILILIGILNGIISLTNICQRKNLKCKGFYNKYNIFETICKKYECFGNFSYTCGQYYCTADENTCLNLKALNSDQIRKIIGPTFFKSNMKKT